MNINKKEEGDFRKMIFAIGLMIALQLAIILFSKEKLYFIISATSYMWFHTISEFATIIIGITIFYYANGSYKQSNSNSVRLIGWAFLGMAIIDIFHTFAYKGFPNPFFQTGGNVGIWFWLPARLLGACLLFLSAFFSWKNIKSKSINILKFLIIIFIISLIPLVIYNTFNNILPMMFIEGQGLTPLKIFLEYLAMSLFGCAGLFYIFVLYENKNKTLLFFIMGLISSAFSELAFTLYRNVFDIFNMLGHVLKVVAYIFFLWGLLYSIKKKEK